MKRHLGRISFLVCALVLCQALLASAQRLDDASFEGRAYTNHFLEFRYTLPDGFTPANLPGGTLRYRTGMFRLITAAERSSRQGVFVLTELGASFTDAKSAEPVLRRFADVVATDYIVAAPVTDQRYGGRRFFSFTARFASGYALVNITSWRGYTLGFLFTASSEAELDSLAVSLDSLDFFGPEMPLPVPVSGGSDSQVPAWSSPEPPDCPDTTDLAGAGTTERIPISRQTERGLNIYRVQPLYSPLARTARIQGRVELAVVIGCSGAIREVRVLSGQPMLVAGAVEAVRQWRYQPYMQKGKPVEVETHITITFTLQ